MRKFYTLSALLTIFLSANLFAQDILVVTPGVGTLNAAIAANGGNKIYQLQAGQFYQIDAIIENVDYHLQIIGEEPAAGAIPATLQSGQTPGGTAFSNMFTPKGDLTLKNLYLMNVDLTGQIGDAIIHQSDSGSTTIVDNCIIDPVSKNNGLIFDSKNQKIYFTNNLVIRMGHQLNPNDGHFFVAQGVGGVGVDSLVVENNTFVSMGTNMWIGGFNASVHNFVWWNHNTFVNQKSQIDWSLFEKEYYWTNNLMFNLNTQPWATPWGAMPGHDIGYLLPSLIYADTIPGETLPSTRVQFIEYNAHYRNPGFQALVDEINNLNDNDTINNVYLMPLVWPADSAGSREAKLFADDVTFPNWKYGNYMVGTDPGFNDARIYTAAENFVAWTKPATFIHALSFPADGKYPDGTAIPVVSAWPQWHWDPDGDPAINEAWPVFDGTYTNAQLLKGSIENLPLGDLNWFPDKKAMWEADKDKIMTHILALNTDKISLTSVEKPEFRTLSVYPNPANSYIRISNQDEIRNVRIYSVTGVLQYEASLTGVVDHIVSLEKFAKGIYLIEAEAVSGKTYINKFIKK